MTQYCDDCGDVTDFEVDEDGRASAPECMCWDAPPQLPREALISRGQLEMFKSKEVSFMAECAFCNLAIHETAGGWPSGRMAWNGMDFHVSCVNKVGKRAKMLETLDSLLDAHLREIGRIPEAEDYGDASVHRRFADRVAFLKDYRLRVEEQEKAEEAALADLFEEEDACLKS